jgi:cyclohexadieny/prephenate dehydrogenase
MATSPIPHFTLLGLGLIGSSLALAAREQGVADRITGYDADEDTTTYCLKRGIIDHAAASAAEAVKDADMVILAAPPSCFAALVAEITPHLKAGAILSDVGSVKTQAAELFQPLLVKGKYAIPAHPIAGSEQSGPQAGDATLFSGKRVIITPLEATPQPPLERLIGFWQQLGSKVELLPVEVHDRVYAYVSHLPQLLSFAATDTLITRHGASLENEAFRAFMRLGASSPQLWRDIFAANATNLLEALEIFTNIFSHIAGELASGDETGQESEEDDVAMTHIFPYLLGSSLVSTVSHFERHSGLSLARYAGKGFSTVTSPLAQNPEQVLEHTSRCWRQVATLCTDYLTTLEGLKTLLRQHQPSALEQRLAEFQQAFLQAAMVRN